VHEGSRKAIVAALVANAGIAAAKFVGFAFTGSSSMLAEAFHSVADTGNQGLLFLGGHRATRDATEKHPFGYGRERYFWSFIVALVLFMLGGLFAIYEGVHKVRHPEDISSPAWAFGILGVAVVLESFSLRTAVQAAAPERGRTPWAKFIRTSRNPELPVVLLEDLGALFGLLFALAGVTLTVVTGDARFDGAGTLAIGVLLVAIAIVLAIEMKSLLIGEGATPATERRIVAALEGGDAVRRVIHMRTEHIGPEELLVAAKVEFAPALSVAELAGAVDAAEARLRSAVPAARIVYLEPDLYREGGTQR